MKRPVTKSRLSWNVVVAICLPRPILSSIASCLLRLKAIVSFARECSLYPRVSSRARPLMSAPTHIYTWHRKREYVREHEVAPRYATRGSYASVGRQGPRGTVSRYCKPVPLSNQTDPAWTDPRFLISYFRIGKRKLSRKYLIVE